MADQVYSPPHPKRTIRRAEYADDHDHSAVHFLAQAVDEPFRKPVAMGSTGGQHQRDATIPPSGTTRDYGRIPTVESA